MKTVNQNQAPPTEFFLDYTDFTEAGPMILWLNHRTFEPREMRTHFDGEESSPYQIDLKFDPDSYVELTHNCEVSLTDGNAHFRWGYYYLAAVRAAANRVSITLKRRNG